MMTRAGISFRRCLPIAALVLGFLWQAGLAVAFENRTGFVDRVFKDEAGEHKYVVFVPANYVPTKKWQVILFLHGAGERGTDGRLQTTVGLGPLVKDREKSFPFVVVFPQCEDVKGRILTAWSPESPDGKRALAILDQVEKDLTIDPQQEIVVGWSMGGYGAWAMAAAFPERWHSVIPVSGGGDPATAEKMKNVPIWAVHGTRDSVVRPEESRKMIAALRKIGGQPRYSEVPDGDHNVWQIAFDDDAVYAWMLNPTRGPIPPNIALYPRSGQRTGKDANLEPPFVPALEIPRVAYVRLGNEMLAALADSIPQVVPRDALTGYLNDISDYTSSEGYTFSVYFSGISYQGQLARASVKAYRSDRVNVQLGLSNVVITISGTSISGESHSASAGPISIVIGHQRPVWLSFDVTPYVENRELRLKHVATAFSIPGDNWYVSGPAGVSVRGFGLTREKVSNGLVSGLYGQRNRIEQQVASVVPKLVKQLEEKLDISSANKVIESVWPLPVYQPRLRAWPAEVSTDEQGVSLVLGVTAAAVDPTNRPRQVAQVPPVGLSVREVPRTTKLRVGLAPQMLGPLSNMLIEADVARIHVADTPSKSLAKLSDPKVLAEAIPDLARYGEKVEVWSELVLTAPISIVDATQDAANGAADKKAAGDAEKDEENEAKSVAEKKGNGHPAPGRQFAFEVPKLSIAVAIKANGEGTWKPYAEFDFKLSQRAEPQLLKPNFVTRELALEWTKTGHVEIEGRFAKDYQPENSQMDLDRVKSLFETGWDEFIHGGPAAETNLQDIDLGYTKLRATEVGWAPPKLFAEFGAPGLKIANLTDKPLVYETKGPYSGWGGPYTLKPGDFHEFPITYPMVFRRRTDRGYQMYTLPVGTFSEFRTPTEGGPLGLYQARETIVPPPETADLTVGAPE
jgi:pimeloyl-ACP methyl ester carboxylesterase